MIFAVADLSHAPVTMNIGDRGSDEMWRHHVTGLIRLYNLMVDNLSILLVLNPLVAQMVMAGLVWSYTERTSGYAGDAVKAADS